MSRSGEGDRDPRVTRDRGREVDATEAARRWADVWSRAWPAADLDAVVALYSRDAVFFSHPFRPRQDVREYVAWAFADQASAECRFGEPLVDGDRAAVEWWGAITTRSGEVETIPGVSLLRFDDEGLVVEQRDVWASQIGAAAIALPHWAPRG